MHVLLNPGPVSYTVQAYSGESGAEAFPRRPYKCFPSDDKVVVLSATWKTSTHLYMNLNVHTGEMQNDYKTSIKDKNYWATSTHPRVIPLCVLLLYVFGFFVL